jgi:membrane fusion protein (multidrug efflux system)
MPNIFLAAPTRWLLIVVVALALAAGGWAWWRHAARFLSTDDAYVGAHVIQIVPQVAGKIVRVAVHDNQLVRRGELLFEIDPEPYRLALIRAQAQLALARQQARADTADVAVARAQVSEQSALAANAGALARRDEALVAKGFLSPQADETAKDQARAAASGLTAARARLQQARAVAGSVGVETAGVRQAQAKLAQAELDLAHTRVTTPTNGQVSQLGLRPGDVVAGGQAVFALVDSSEFWVDANFKETELARIRVGQAATVSVDLYPDRVFHGVVESVSPGAGSAFSLLPPENASGNWVKVAQRVPVRVRILDPDSEHPLRLGVSATVSIDSGP